MSLIDITKYAAAPAVFHLLCIVIVRIWYREIFRPHKDLATPLLKLREVNSKAYYLYNLSLALPYAELLIILFLKLSGVK